MSQDHSIIYVNYCTRGSCEIRLDHNLSTCVSDNELCISTIPATKDCYFPQRVYEGIELYFDLDILKEHSGHVLGEFDFDFYELLTYYVPTHRPYLSIANAKFQALFEEIWQLRADESLFMKRIKILDFLHLLQEKSMPLKGDKRKYLTTSQVKIAKIVEQQVTEDLRKNVSISALSQRFGVSETSLRSYFRLFYGQNIAEYLRVIRMKEAAKYLSQTSRKVSDIAAAVGYENQSKFSAVFKAHYEVSPLEYRRLSQLNQGQMD